MGIGKDSSGEQVLQGEGEGGGYRRCRWTESIWFVINL